jgi:hypothetical protein
LWKEILTLFENIVFVEMKISKLIYSFNRHVPKLSRYKDTMSKLLSIKNSNQYKAHIPSRKSKNYNTKWLWNCCRDDHQNKYPPSYLNQFLWNMVTEMNDFVKEMKWMILWRKKKEQKSCCYIFDSMWKHWNEVYLDFDLHDLVYGFHHLCLQATMSEVM